MRRLLSLASALPLLLLPACKQPLSSAAVREPVIFQGTGLELTPGGDWIQVDTSRLAKEWRQDVVQPTLTRGGAMITARILGPGPSAEPAEKEIRAAFERDPLADPGSLKREEFAAESGLKGTIFRHTRHVNSEAKPPAHRRLTYLFNTNRRRWVTISAEVDPNDADETMVRELFRKTLREVPLPTVTPTPTGK